MLTGAESNRLIFQSEIWLVVHQWQSITDTSQERSTLDSCYQISGTISTALAATG